LLRLAKAPHPKFLHMTRFGLIVLTVVGLKWITQLWLEWLNARNVRAHAVEMPEALRGVVDPATYSKSVEYTLAKSRFRQGELTYETVLLLLVLFTGILPWLLNTLETAWGGSPWAMAAFLIVAGMGLSMPDLPFSWYDQFRLEEKFGFNTTTQSVWWSDRLKGLALGIVLGYPLLVLILFITKWAGSWWWFWAWSALMIFQLLMVVLAPVLIMPLFNKFTPLPPGQLRERLLDLAERTHFHAKSIQVMDGSKRSRHSNAFFVGFGGFRKIVLFDTLIQQLLEPELEAVLAHEIGHFRRKHIPKMLLASALGSLAGFYVLSELARQAWFYQAFGFSKGNFAPALLVFGLLSGAATFWLSPILHSWSRRYEYQADEFAAQAMAQPDSLIGALRKLNEKNLSNLTPHPFYSGFYYSHPTLLERERALQRVVL
jgi:STE24 endopeptidase